MKNFDAKVVFWGRSGDAESEAALGQSLALVILQEASVAFVPSGLQYRLGEGDQTYDKGLFRSEAPWWPEWTVLVQHAGYGPQVMVPGETGFTHQEPRIIRMRAEAILGGHVQGLPAHWKGMRVLVELPIADLARLHSDESTPATGSIRWESAVAQDGRFQIKELPAGLHLDMAPVDARGLTIAESKQAALSSGEARQVTLSLE